MFHDKIARHTIKMYTAGVSSTFNFLQRPNVRSEVIPDR